VSVIAQWYREGRDVTSKVPALSTYLGHRDPRSTYWYLSAAPELLALAADRLERVVGDYLASLGVPGIKLGE
jgi:integrase/recombinase XerD